VVTGLRTYPELVDRTTGLVLASPDEPINLVAEADSPNGLPLSIRWTADGGQFSDAREWLPMTYSEDDDKWKSSLLWSLPPTPAPLQNVSVEVRDEFGNSSASTSVSQLSFDTEDRFPWELAFVSRTASSLEADVEWMKGDGSGRIAVIEDEARPPDILVSPNGEFIAWKSGDFTLGRRLFISSRAGNLLRTVNFPADIGGPLIWSPDGTRLLVNDVGVNPTTVWEVNPSDGSRAMFTTLPTEASLYSVSANLRYFAYRNQSNRRLAIVYDRIDGVERTIFTGAAGGYGPVDLQLSAQGNYCGFYDQTGPGHRTILARTDGSGHLDLGWGGVAYVSPDENTVVYTSNSSAGGGTTTFIVANIDGTTRFTDATLTDYSTIFSADSRFAVKQVATFADNRLVAFDLTTGEVVEIAEDDGLAKFRINVIRPN
jgi:hypothetical protein